MLRSRRAHILPDTKIQKGGSKKKKSEFGIPRKIKAITTYKQEGLRDPSWEKPEKR
ncbi:hypothetical protein LEP1GSC061_2172 [Leptospira wolffii serovar Khorat str. Khorat-H2]|nr:hypothetical protein LEP1GSC061_2172 [Leptospira wolffii serovar Khorat str. Khorat-H2]